MSTTLLLLPEFLIGNVEAYTSFTDTITQVAQRSKSGGQTHEVVKLKRPKIGAIRGAPGRRLPNRGVFRLFGDGPAVV